MPIRLAGERARAREVIVRTLVSSGGGRIVADQLPQQLLAHAMRLPARRLGIGRATLYQKLTEYGRDGKQV